MCDFILNFLRLDSIHNLLHAIETTWAKARKPGKLNTRKLGRVLKMNFKITNVKI